MELALQLNWLWW